MSTFTDLFIQSFGEAFPGYAHPLRMPCLRVELAKGTTRRRRLAEAERRCLTILKSVVGSDRQVWLQLSFYENIHFPTPDKQMAILKSYGLEPVGGCCWEEERVIIDPENPEDKVICHTFSGQTSSESKGIEALIKAIVWKDHGTWERLTLEGLFVDTNWQIGYYPYDDRGADLFATKPEKLQPYYDKFSEWILDSDRPRIERELGRPKST